MSAQLNVNVSVNVNGAAAYQASPVEVGAVDININQTFGTGTTNQLLAAAFTVTSIQGFCLTPTTNMTLKTNSSGSPAQTFNLVAGEPFMWKKGWSGWYANPFTVDVTAFYITCAAAGSLKGHVVTA